MQDREKEYVYRRSRSVAIVVRDGKILMERVFCFGREFFTVPGGGIEAGETPEQAALRELKEECGLDGTIVRPLTVQYKDRGAEYSFEIRVPEDQEPVTGYDPEESAEDPPLKEVLWMALDEISEKDRAFLWSYGLIQVDGFFEEIRTWGDDISYPHRDGKNHGRMQEGTAMDTFSDALLCSGTDRIPDSYDWFAPLIGDWDCDYYDEPADHQKRHVKGEWLFRRILEGTGIQDVFIFPSRSTKESNPQPDGEYGTSLRMFNRDKGWYDVVYTCERCMKRLCFRKEGDRLVGKVLDEENAFWVFSDISDNSFHWENMTISPDGSRTLICEIFGRRIK